MAPGFLLLKQSIFHHVNHITTDPLLRTRSFTVSPSQRCRTAESTLGELGLGQYLSVALLSKKVQTRGDPGKDAMLTHAQNWWSPRHYHIREFIQVASVADKQGRWHYSNLLTEKWIRKLTKLRKVTQLF